MKYIYLFFIIFFLLGCSSTKTVLICGDHVCVNKSEAEQYFEENLSIEVKIVNSKIENQIDLVELNLKSNNQGRKKISVISKKNTDIDLKNLSNKEKIKIKKVIKNKKKEKKIVKKIIKSNNDKNITKNVNKKLFEVADVCTIIKKCSIEEISKYLTEQHKKRGFPDITKRQ